ncbi:Non-structural maintenance of chromosomes element 1 -like protein [Escovopsis weberi]|uniref:Non-structural maintenance of chromosomes element 1 homolog n=1 Tax=Escovopsis weberi TaxID=150374 RepID=A0A0N0RTX8_ESCWE|nr:Non-structural maintenance of chromosomes element 1 -like protein [Escovopsis weberi]
MDRLFQDGYGHGNRAFLQALLARGTITFKDSRPLIAAIMNADRPNDDDLARPDHVTEDMFLDYIHKASQAASLFDYEIRSGVHQITKQRIYALINTASDPQTQLATTYSPEELSFINRVLDAMFDKFNTPRMESMCITGLQATRLSKPCESQAAGGDQSLLQQEAAAADKGLKHSEVELVMSNLLAGGWFEKSKDNFYSLTPRALLELRPWLIDSYNDPDAEPGDWQRIKFCEACKDIVTYGLRCSEPDCNARLHDICQDAYWKTRREKKCPKCSRDWTEKLYVGERSITMTAAYQKGQKKSGARRRTLADEIALSQGVEDNGEHQGHGAGGAEEDEG